MRSPDPVRFSTLHPFVHGTRRSFGDSQNRRQQLVKALRKGEAHNWWDDTVKRGNVFFLKDRAVRWFENHEKVITSWETFITAVQDKMGPADTRRHKTDDCSANLIQAVAESSTAYMQDVFACLWLNEPQNA